MNGLVKHIDNEDGAQELGYVAFLHDHRPEDNPYEDEVLKGCWLAGYMQAWVEEEEAELETKSSRDRA